jgi:hypothetical protein
MNDNVVTQGGAANVTDNGLSAPSFAYAKSDDRSIHQGMRSIARRKKRSPEQVVSILRQVGAGLAQGKTTSQCCKDLQIPAQTYHQWKRKYGGLEEHQATRLKQLEQENANLKRIVSELCLQKQALKDLIVSGGI